MSEQTTDRGVSWGWQEAVLEFFSPRAAQQRYSARIASANLRRAYDGAAKGRLSDGWRTANTSADSEIRVAGGLLRDRMRDLVRNNALAAQAVQVLVNNIVGTGIRPRAATGKPELDKQIDKFWQAWSARCDAHGHTDFHGLTALAVREMIEGGDLFALRRPRRTRRTSPVPLEIELFEADHLDGSKFDDSSEGTRISTGIEYDRTGRRVGYWMFPDHPGDTSPAFRRKFESIRISAQNVAHLFERQRVQSRGVPWGTPAIRALQDLGDWQVAEMVRKKTEACLVGVVVGEEGDGTAGITPEVKDSDGKAIESFRPGMFGYTNGRDIKFNSPANSGGVREWNITQMLIISAGFRVPYALMTNDMSQANFSSNRAGLNEFRRMVEQVQWSVVIPMFCQRIWDWFCEAAWTAGLIEQPDIPVEWAPPRFESVNPWQDAQTDLLETRAGFSSLPQQIAKRGYDLREVLEEQIKALKIADELGLVLDSDPRKVTRVGQAQSTSPGEADTATKPDNPAT
ncbi:phage portal protein [Seohaeicola zhoushanensis]|uniref:Phage portal protein n=1 Tax=Seohaeicola zhoushanensis TaxID=1569283 RepID=A0A8J3MC54_9RHOB|nr:phage portal protein [Seohaeicola zhoushanensis]GHF71123.1 phage portal protein [Seohaeicola zhoushanensis]